jgi:Fungal N-terminal domain of STAND proteins
MEALGAAGSVVGLAAALGQIIEGVTQLHDFWSSVKEVPKSLLWLITDLEILHDILRSIDSSSAQLSPSSDTSALNGVLQKCALYLKTLQETVKPLQSETGVSTAKRTWRSVKAVFSTEKIKSYRENLEAAKVTLLLAQSQLNQ